MIYGMASVLPRVINFALLAIFTSVFNTSQFSSQTRWYVYAAFLNVILTLGIETSFFRFYTAETNKEKIVSTASMLLIISSFTFLVLGMVAAPVLTVFFGFEQTVFVRILVWTTVLDTLVVIPFALLRVSGRPLRFMVLKLSNVLFLALITVVLLLGIPYMVSSDMGWSQTLGIDADYKPGILHIFIANVAASLFTLLCLFPEIMKIKWKWDKDIVKKLMTYGLPIMVGGLAYAVNENVDKLIIPRFIGEDANGIYAACYKLGVFMTLYITAFRMGAEPFFFNHAGTTDAKKKYSVIMTWFVIFGCLFILLVVGFVDMIAGLFIRQSSYLSGLTIVPIILLANLFSGIYNNLAIWYKLTDKTRFGMYISIAGALLTIVSLMVFVPWMGIMGGAAATLFTYFFMAMISWYFGHKHYPVPYESGKIALLIACTSLLSGVSFLWFRGDYFINSALICIYVMIIYYLEKTTIKTIFSRTKTG